jgi:hypothetical protein
MSSLAAVGSSVLAAVLVLSLAAPAHAAGRRAAVSDPTGDVVSDPLASLTPQGPPTWADLTGASFALGRDGRLAATLALVDVPEGRGAPTHRATWILRGTVVRAGGRKSDFDVLLDDSGSPAAAFFGDRRCRTTTAIDPAANTVTMLVDLGARRCLPGAVRVKVHVEATVNSSRSERNPNGSLTYYNRPVHLDEAQAVTLVDKRRRR